MQSFWEMTCVTLADTFLPRFRMKILSMHQLIITYVGQASLPSIALTCIDRYFLSLPASVIRVCYLAYGATNRIQLNKLVDHLARIHREVGFKSLPDGFPTGNRPGHFRNSKAFSAYSAAMPSTSRLLYAS